jgi:hypothetical protein
MHMLKGAPDNGLSHGRRLSHNQLAALAGVTLCHKQLHITIQTAPVEVLLHVRSQLTDTSMAKCIMHTPNNIPTIRQKAGT